MSNMRFYHFSYCFLGWYKIEHLGYKPECLNWLDFTGYDCPTLWQQVPAGYCEGINLHCLPCLWIPPYYQCSILNLLLLVTAVSSDLSSTFGWVMVHTGRQLLYRDIWNCTAIKSVQTLFRSIRSHCFLHKYIV